MKKVSKKELNDKYWAKLDTANRKWHNKIYNILCNIESGTGKIPDMDIRTLQQIIKLNHLIGMFQYSKALNSMQNLDTITREDDIPYTIWDLLHKINGVEY